MKNQVMTREEKILIKLIALDLDGTLLKKDKTISQKNIDCLRQAKALGVKIVICTGRPLAAIEAIIDEIGLRDTGDYSITFNGGAVQANASGEVMRAHFLNRSQVEDVFTLMQKIDLPLDVISEATCYHLPTAKEHPSIYQTLNPILSYEDVTLEELPKDIPYHKMVVAYEMDYLDEKIKVIPTDYYQKFNMMKSRTRLLEILHPEVSKANAINELATHLGIEQAEVMAIGDEENDRSMIEYAGIGVVMGNGNPELKKVAQFVSTTNEEDGVAHAIETLVLPDYQ